MYLVNKLCGVRIGRMYVPACLKEYTTKIVCFVLSSPGVDKNKAEFQLEGEKNMETQDNKGLDALIEEITKPSEDESSGNETQNEPVDENGADNFNPMDVVLPLVIKALMQNSLMTKEIILDIDRRVTLLENKKCNCEQSESEGVAA